MVNYKRLFAKTKVVTPVEVIEEVKDDASLLVKAKADSLVKLQDFGGALLLIEEQLAQDSLSMKDYLDYISRLRGVVEMQKMKK